MTVSDDKDKELERLLWGALSDNARREVKRRRDDLDKLLEHVRKDAKAKDTDKDE